MDPLSVSASIIGPLQLTGSVLWYQRYQGCFTGPGCIALEAAGYKQITAKSI